MTARVIQGVFAGGRSRVAPELLARPPLPAAPAFPPGRPPVAQPKGRPPVIQRRAGGEAVAVDPARLGLANGGGLPLPDPVRGRMEAALGADFAAVRIHVGPQAARIGALAFTLGTDIYFAPGRFQPDTAQGQRLLGHELAHVVQQRQGRVRHPTGSGVAVVQDPILEAEADRLGRQAAVSGSIQARAAASSSRSAFAPHVNRVRSALPPDYRRFLDAARSQSARAATVGPIQPSLRPGGANPVRLRQRWSASGSQRSCGRPASPERTTGRTAGRPLAIQRDVVPATAKGQGSDYPTYDVEAAAARTFAKILDVLTAAAYGDILSGAWTGWPATQKILNFDTQLKSDNDFLKITSLGYAIEERIYQLLGWSSGEKTGKVKVGDDVYEWSGQGSSLISKGTLPDVILHFPTSGREAWYDITSDRDYKLNNKLHIVSKSPPWTNVSAVIYIAEIQYNTVTAETLVAIASGKKIDPAVAKKLSEDFLDQEAQRYADNLVFRQKLVKIILYLHSKGIVNAFKAFRDHFFDGSLMATATTEANNFLRFCNIKNITGQPQTHAAADASTKRKLMARFLEVLEVSPKLQEL